MDKKDLYVEKMKAQLDLWADELEQMEAQAHMAEAELKIRYLDQLETLRQQREKARRQLTRIRESGDEAWEELKTGTDAAWDDIREAFARARDKLNNK
jgi:multidrug resistance efflux pump